MENLKTECILNLDATILDVDEDLNDENINRNNNNDDDNDNIDINNNNNNNNNNSNHGKTSNADSYHQMDKCLNDVNIMSADCTSSGLTTHLSPSSISSVSSTSSANDLMDLEKPILNIHFN